MSKIVKKNTLPSGYNNWLQLFFDVKHLLNDPIRKEEVNFDFLNNLTTKKVDDETDSIEIEWQFLFNKIGQELAEILPSREGIDNLVKYAYAGYRWHYLELGPLPDEVEFPFKLAEKIGV